MLADDTEKMCENYFYRKLGVFMKKRFDNFVPSQAVVKTFTTVRLPRLEASTARERARLGNEQKIDPFHRHLCSALVFGLW